jgi:hypothetical protein
MAVSLFSVVGLALLLGVCILAAVVRRQLGCRDSLPITESRRALEAEISTRSNSPYV